MPHNSGLNTGDYDRTAQRFGHGGGSGGGSSGGFNLEDFMSRFSQPSGLFGLGDTATGGLLSAGSTLLGGLGGLIGGDSEEDKLLKQSREQRGKVFNLAENRLGQSPTDPQQYLAEFMRATAEDRQRREEGAARSFGVNSGRFASAGNLGLQRDQANFLLPAKQRADELKFQNDNMLLRLMSGVS